MIDYRKLLSKYMSLVGSNEGTHFLGGMNIGDPEKDSADYWGPVFTQEEADELQKISDGL